MGEVINILIYDNILDLYPDMHQFGMIYFQNGEK